MKADIPFQPAASATNPLVEEADEGAILDNVEAVMHLIQELIVVVEEEGAIPLSSEAAMGLYFVCEMAIGALRYVNDKGKGAGQNVFKT